jgi:CRP/FNR family transcriptional regulator
VNDLSRLLRLNDRHGDLESLGEIRTYPKDQLLIKAGTVPEFCFLVKSGSVAGIRESASGEELIFFIMEPNSIFAEGSVLFNRVCPVSFKTTTESRLAAIKKEPLTRALRNDNQLLFKMLEIECIKFYTAMEDLTRAKRQCVAGQLCDLLADFANRYGAAYDNKVMINHKLSIQLLTSMLGVNRAIVVRAIKSLKDLSLLEYINGYYCIRSVEKLMRHKELISSP